MGPIKRGCLPQADSLVAESDDGLLFGCHRVGTVLVFTRGTRRAVPHEEEDAPYQKEQATDTRNDKESERRGSDTAGKQRTESGNHEQHDPNHIGEHHPKQSFAAAVRVAQASHLDGKARQKQEQPHQGVKNTLSFAEDDLVEQHRYEGEDQGKEHEVPVLGAAGAALKFT